MHNSGDATQGPQMLPTWEIQPSETKDQKREISTSIQAALCNQKNPPALVLISLILYKQMCFGALGSLCAMLNAENTGMWGAHHHQNVPVLLCGRRLRGKQSEMGTWPGGFHPKGAAAELQS